MFKLRVEKGPAGANEFLLREGDTLVGRDPSADFRLTAPDVSRRHLLMRMGRGSVEMEVLSPQGVLLDGEWKVGRVPLRHGSTLHLGLKTMLVLERVSAAEADHLTESASLPPPPEPDDGFIEPTGPWDQERKGAPPNDHAVEVPPLIHGGLDEDMLIFLQDDEPIHGGDTNGNGFLYSSEQPMPPPGKTRKNEEGSDGGGRAGR